MPGPAAMSRLAFPEGLLRQAQQEVRRRTSPHQTVQRCQLVLLLHEHPSLAHEEAGQRVGEPIPRGGESERSPPELHCVALAGQRTGAARIAQRNCVSD